MTTTNAQQAGLSDSSIDTAAQIHGATELAAASEPAAGKSSTSENAPSKQAGPTQDRLEPAAAELTAARDALPEQVGPIEHGSKQDETEQVAHKEDAVEQAGPSQDGLEDPVYKSLHAGHRARAENASAVFQAQRAQDAEARLKARTTAGKKITDAHALTQHSLESADQACLKMVNEMRMAVTANMEAQFREMVRDQVLEDELAIKKSYKRALRAEVEDNLYTMLQPVITAQLLEKLDYPVWTGLTEELKPLVEANLRSTMEPEIRAKLEEEIMPAVIADLRADLRKEVKARFTPIIEAELRAQIEAELKPIIEEELVAKGRALLNPTVEVESRNDVASELPADSNSDSNSSLKRSLKHDEDDNVRAQSKHVKVDHSDDGRETAYYDDNPRYPTLTPASNNEVHSSLKRAFSPDREDDVQATDKRIKQEYFADGHETAYYHNAALYPVLPQEFSYDSSSSLKRVLGPNEEDNVHDPAKLIAEEDYNESEFIGTGEGFGKYDSYDEGDDSEEEVGDYDDDVANGDYDENNEVAVPAPYFDDGEEDEDAEGSFYDEETEYDQGVIAESNTQATAVVIDDSEDGEAQEADPDQTLVVEDEFVTMKKDVIEEEDEEAGEK